jgi:uncharacterized protein (TIGR02996 family)
MMIRPIVVLIREPGIEERIASFEKKEITIGCSEDADLCLVHASISTELRARIRRQDGELVLTNYCGAAPVKVNGNGVNLRAVAHGDVISIGEIEIMIVSDTRLDPREQALVDDIVNDPSDETLRSVYSDWLEENGFKDRAEYLRLDATVNKALKSTWGPKIREDVGLLAGLTRNLPPAWLALMRRRPKK